MSPFRWLTGRLSSRAPSIRRRPHPIVLGCEQMEDRALPSAVWLELIQSANERTGDDAVIRVWRDGDTSAALTAEVQMSGTATYDTDYSGFNGTSVTLGAGSDHTDLHFTPIQNNTPDALTIVANLQPGMGYDMGSPAIATAAIVDSTAATFVLGSAGNLRYDVPWGSVDPAQASQSLALSNFAITVSDGMSTYTLTPSNASFTTSPTAQFAYGVMTGITFAIDTSSIGGFAYSSVSMSGWTLSAVDALTSAVTTAAVADYGSMTLKFDGVAGYNDATIAFGGIANWQVKITLHGTVDGQNQTWTYFANFSSAATDTSVVSQFYLKLKADGWLVDKSPDGKELTFQGTTSQTLTGAVYQTLWYDSLTETYKYDAWARDNFVAPTPQGGTVNITMHPNP